MFEGHLIKLSKNSLSLSRFSGFAGNLRRNSKNKSLNNFVRILSFSLILSISFYSIANAGVCFLPAMKGNDCVDDDSTLACPPNKQRSCSSNQKPINQEILSDGTYCYSCVAIKTKETCPELYQNFPCAEKYKTEDTKTINDGANTCYKCRELTCNELYGSKSGDLTYFSETECNGRFNPVIGNTTATGTQCGTCIDKVTCADKYNDNNYMTEAECKAIDSSYPWTLGDNEDENNPSPCGECKIPHDHDQDPDPDPEEVTCEELGKSKGVTYCPYTYGLQAGTSEYAQVQDKFNKCKARFADKFSTGYTYTIEEADHASDGDCVQIIQKCEGYVNDAEFDTYYDSHCYKKETCPGDANFVKLIEHPDIGYGIYGGECRRTTCDDLGYSEKACEKGYIDVPYGINGKTCHQCVEYGSYGGGGDSYCFTDPDMERKHQYVVGSISNKYYEDPNLKEEFDKLKAKLDRLGAKLMLLHSAHYPTCIVMDTNFNMCKKCVMDYFNGDPSHPYATCANPHSDTQSFEYLQTPIEEIYDLPGSFDCHHSCIAEQINCRAIGNNNYSCDGTWDYSNAIVTDHKGMRPIDYGDDYIVWVCKEYGYY